ncbi:tRNA wybutosine-synthesizing protein 3 homolog isoform 2-T2 [Odontesthes bonariensis]|uniref:tRNA wybutosine-synthesizing protein 3 homolog isoform X2 n=1 Tax=Odontesthes bonariensis TaxID=219752 RepID=UPI003F58B571
MRKKKVAMEKTFGQWKKQCLNKLDLSKKGSVDEDIQHVVSLLNSCEEFFTTSSCSGRIILTDGMSGLSRSNGDAVLKFEPLVLHIQCQKLEDAQLMHSVAINSGFKNSGLTVNKKGKIITAVRSTHCLEVPLSHDGKLLVEHEYIHFLTQIANQKMEENFRRLQRFYQNLQTALSSDRLHNPHPLASQEQQDLAHSKETAKIERNETTVNKPRQRSQHKTDCYHGDGDSSLLELDDCLYLFT